MRTGRPPRPASPGSRTTITIRISAEVKNALIEQADALDLSISEYITTLVARDLAETEPGFTLRP